MTDIDKTTHSINDYLKVLSKYPEITPEALEEIINAPTLNRNNVQLYLNSLPVDDLAQLFYVSAIVKVTESELIRKHAGEQDASTPA